MSHCNLRSVVETTMLTFMNSFGSFQFEGCCSVEFELLCTCV